MNKYMRREVTDRLLSAMNQAVTIQQYDSASSFLENLSDSEFDQFYAEMVRIGSSHAPISPKEYMKKLEEMRKLNHITYENTAMRRIPLSYLDEAENEELWQEICKSQPSDHIHLKRKDDEALCDLWKQSSSIEEGSIPSDLFFAGKIPLHDCKIIVDERDQPGGELCTYRVVVFSDYKERIKTAGEELVYVAAIVLQYGSHTAFIPLIVQEGVDMIGIGQCGQHGIPKSRIEENRKNVSMQDIINMAYSYLETWYGIQVALLHPMLKEVFRHPRTERVYNPGTVKSGKHKRITRYVKTHVINADEIRQAAAGTGQEYTRHTLIWYVIGHWRRYANGKKVFIQPYWKGALRHLKMDIEGRDREIVIGEDNG